MTVAFDPKAAKIDAEIADEERQAALVKRQDFDRLYFRWLEARALLANPDGDDADAVKDAQQDAVDKAGRQLLAMPAFLDWMIWKKWEVLDLYLDADIVGGAHVDNRTVVALACIKADLMRLGIGKQE
jgi:hypothetical protein